MFRSLTIKASLLVLLLFVFSILLPNIRLSTDIKYTESYSNENTVNILPELNTRMDNISRFDEIYAWIPHFDFQRGLQSAISNRSKLQQVHLSGASIDANGDVVYSSNFNLNLNTINQNNLSFGINIISVNPSNTSIFLSKSQDKLFTEIREYKKLTNFKSVNLNIENLSSADSKNFLNFLKEFRTFLNSLNLKLFVTLYPISINSSSGYTSDSLGGYREIIQYTDFLVIMFYDSHRFTKIPGSSPLDWYKKGVDLLSNEVGDWEKVIVGLPLFGYGFNNSGGIIGSYVYTQIQNIAKSPSINSNSEMTYKRGEEIIYFQDSNSLKIRKQYAKDKLINKFFYWRLGGESGLEL